MLSKKIAINHARAFIPYLDNFITHSFKPEFLPSIIEYKHKFKILVPGIDLWKKLNKGVTFVFDKNVSLAFLESKDFEKKVQEFLERFGTSMESEYKAFLKTAQPFNVYSISDIFPRSLPTGRSPDSPGTFLSEYGHYRFLKSKGVKYLGELKYRLRTENENLFRALFAREAQVIAAQLNEKLKACHGSAKVVKSGPYRALKGFAEASAMDVHTALEKIAGAVLRNPTPNANIKENLVREFAEKAMKGPPKVETLRVFLKDLELFPRADTFNEYRECPVIGTLNFPENLADAAFENTDKDEALRVDLDKENFTAYAVDKKSTNDVDDAISIDPDLTKDGEFRFFVHVADVASYVPMDSVAFYAACEKMVSVYHPDDVHHVFQRDWVQKMSLGENKTNRTLTVEIFVNKEGEITKYNIFLGKLSNLKRITYRAAEKLLQMPDSQSTSKDSDEFAIKRLAKVSALVLKQRLRRSALNVTGLQAKELKTVRTKEAGDRKKLSFKISRKPKVSDQMIENLMISANHVVALYAVECGRSLPFRVMSAQASSVPTVDAVPGRPQPWVEWARLRRELGAAFVHPKAEAHALVGVRPYCHVTSPIRRISDLLAHHQVRAVLKGQPPPFSDLYLGDFCVRFNQIQRNRNLLMRARLDYWLLVHLAEKLGKSKKPITMTFTVCYTDAEIVVFVERKHDICCTQKLASLPFRPSLYQRVKARVTAVSPEGERIDLDVVESRENLRRVEAKSIHSVFRKSHLQRYAELRHQTKYDLGDRAECSKITVNQS